MASRPKQTKAWTRWVNSIKSQTTADRSPSATLKKMIDDYCISGEFDRYLADHVDDVQNYLRDFRVQRRLFRASAAGKCLQMQAFNAVEKQVIKDEGIDVADLVRVPENRPATQYRALHNGTFAHVRWHLIFDALHKQGKVLTLFAETYRFRDDLNLDGTVDRVIEFKFGDEVIRAIIDFKTMRSYFWERLVKPVPDNEYQLHAYAMFEFDAPHWILLYENKDTHELKIYEALVSEITLQRLRHNYRLLNTWVQKFVYEPEEPRLNLPLIVTWCRYCPWQKACADEHPDLKEQQAKIGEDTDEVADDVSV